MEGPGEVTYNWQSTTGQLSSKSMSQTLLAVRPLSGKRRWVSRKRVLAASFGLSGSQQSSFALMQRFGARTSRTGLEPFVMSDRKGIAQISGTASRSDGFHLANGRIVVDTLMLGLGPCGSNLGRKSSVS